MEDKKPKPRLSIDQAFNFVEELKETAEAETKKKVDDASISMALPRDRVRFLSYGISLLDDVTETDKYEFCRITNHAPVCYTTKDVAHIFRTLLMARIEHISYVEISYHIKATIDEIKKVEDLAKLALKRAIDKVRASGYPLIGGTN